MGDNSIGYLVWQEPCDCSVHNGRMHSNLCWPFSHLQTFPYNTDVSEILLQTKLYIPPKRPNVVPRTQLLHRLHDGLHGKLTMVSAPAGFGKTTLVTDWLSQLDRPVYLSSTIAMRLILQKLIWP